MKDVFFKDKNLPFVECRYTKNSTICYGKHFHETLSIGAIVDGEVEYTCKDKTYTLSKNSLAIINPKTIHSCNPKDDKPRSYFMLYVDMDYLKDGFKQLSFQNPKLEDKKLYDMFLFLSNSLLKNDIFYMEKEQVLYSFLENLYNLIDIELIEIKKDAMKQAQDFMDKSKYENITLDDICKKVGLSKFHFIRFFKLQYHTTPHAYMLNLKINEAKKLLQKGEDISFIAQTLGFFDQSHLNKVFKKHIALTPNEYKKSLHVNPPFFSLIYP